MSRRLSEAPVPVYRAARPVPGTHIDPGRFERLQVTDLRCIVDEQEREIERLNLRLQRNLAERAQLERTRGFRLVHGYWSAVGKARTWGRQARWGARRLASGALLGGPPRPEDCLVGCVTENRPVFLAQAYRLVRSIRWFGGGLSRARVWVCAVEEIDPAARRALEALGAEVRIVPRFDPRNPPANKLGFLSAAAEEDARMILLLDCDTLVVQDPLPFLRRDTFQAKIADIPSVPHEVFQGLFRHYGLPLPAPRYRTTFLATPTIRYCNSGVIAVPADLARDLVPVWRDYNARLLDVPELLGACAHHSNQASLALALAACPVPFREAPPALNFPLHLKHLDPAPNLLSVDPAILHYHQEVDDDGALLPHRYPLVQARIEAFNRRWAEAGGEA
jgi:hypothetical protein